MSEAKHTPGPWVASWNRTGGFSVFPASSIGVQICSRADWDNNSDESRSNARLIAAAPELLAALCGLCEADRDDLNDSTSTVWNDAVAAIAKATGQ